MCCEAFFNTMHGKAYKYIWSTTPALQCHCIVVLTVTSSDLIICPDNIEDGHDTVPIQVPAHCPGPAGVICDLSPDTSHQRPGPSPGTPGSLLQQNLDMSNMKCASLSIHILVGIQYWLRNMEMKAVNKSFVQLWASVIWKLRQYSTQKWNVTLNALYKYVKLQQYQVWKLR